MAQERGSGGGEMSPIQFRELDDEFMQKQAKVWLEALLEERYGGERSLADLLADGDILFRVSKVFKEMIRSSSGGDAAFPRLPFSEISSTNDAKGGRNLPYSRVDSFLKICKRIGLPDVDLFTPPDVVEKKNLRRVCLCIRALSKKARAQALPVPDFDKVTHTVPMPTDKVGGIRDSLQQAAVASSSPSPSPRTPQPIGKVLSSPSLAGSAFLETPPPANSKPDRMNSNGDSSEVKFEDETASSELPDDELEDKQSVSASPASDPASEVDDGGNDNDPDLELVDEGSGSDDQPPLQDDQEAAQSCSIQPKENPSVQRNQNSGFVLPLVISAVALVVGVLAVVALKRPRKAPDYYVVKEGDTLARISRTCGSGRWTELVEKNPNLASNPDLIYPTDRLKLA